MLRLFRPWRDRRVEAVGRLLRTLFIQRALRSDREPASIADAYAWAYDEVQRLQPRSAAAVPPERVSQFTDENLDFAVDLSLRSLEIQSPSVIQHEREVQAIAKAAVTAEFEPALDQLRILRAVAHESCEAFHSQHGTHTARHTALTRLTARGMLVADEAQHLLEGGYPSGALARWRSLHEVSVIAAVISEADESTARRYLDHEAVTRAKAANDHQKHAAALGAEPLPQKTFDEIASRRTMLLAEHGRTFKGEYGWAAHLLPGANFRALEELVGADWLRPYYRLANHPVHAGAGNLLNEIGVDDDRALLTGPTNSGLTDPIQLTARSLVFLTRQLILSSDDPSLQWVLRAEALERLASRLVETLGQEPAEPETHEADCHRSDPSEDEALSSLLAWPEISWDEVRPSGRHLRWPGRAGTGRDEPLL